MSNVIEPGVLPRPADAAVMDDVIYITGGASGMGLLTAQQLAQRDANIVIFKRQATAARTDVLAIEQVRTHAHQKIASYLVDVAERDQVLAAFALAEHEVGPPSVVIHMAGIGGLATMIDMGYEMFDRIMRINLYGTRNVVEAALKTMRPRGAGQLVLAGSMGGFIPVFGYTAYGASKFAVVGFAQCLRYELKPLGIGVICFCPGEVETPALELEGTQTHPAAVALKAIGGTVAAEFAVRKLIAGIERGKFLIIPGWRSKVVYWAFRLTPLALWNWVTDAIVAYANAKR